MVAFWWHCTNLGFTAWTLAQSGTAIQKTIIRTRRKSPLAGNHTHILLVPLQAPFLRLLLYFGYSSSSPFTVLKPSQFLAWRFDILQGVGPFALADLSSTHNETSGAELHRFVAILLLLLDHPLPYFVSTSVNV